MQITIKADELQVGDLYKGRQIVMVDSDNGNIVLVDFERGAPKAFVKSADVLVERKIEQIELEKGK